MKTDLGKLIALVWMIFTAYILFEIYRDINYLTDLMHAYVKMAVEIAKQ